MLQFNIPQVKKIETLATTFISLRCVSVAEHHAAEQYSKRVKTKPIYQGPLFLQILARISSIYQEFDKLLRKPSEDAQWRESAPRSSVAPIGLTISTAAPTVNVGDWDAFFVP